MKAAAAKLRAWRADPVRFVRDVFRVEPDAWQADVLQAFPHRQRIAMKACKGPGKSTVQAWLGWNFLLTRPHPKVVCTSITADNLRDGLWTEYAKWQQRSPLLKEAFTWSAERITCNRHPETWWGSARTWAKTADAAQQADALAGLHADYMLFEIDEAGGVPDAVAATAEAALASGTETRLSISGNPTELSGPLYRACTTERHLWFVIEISSDPDDPKRTPRVSAQWAREQIQKYGRDNPWVLVNVFGQFPPSQSNVLLGVEDVSKAANRTVGDGDYLDSPKIIGVDVARFGDDKSVIMCRQGLVAFRTREFRNLDGPQLAGHVAQVIHTWDPDAVFVDQTGVGASCVDHLRVLGFQIIGVDNACKPTKPHPLFRNLRAQQWWDMAQWVKGGGCIPDDQELRSELVAPTYWFDPSGRLVIESKDDMKERGIPSPNKADALGLTFVSPVAKKPPKYPGSGQHPGVTAAYEYDPVQ